MNDLGKRLVADLKSVSKSNFTVGTDIGEEREKIFRKFLNNIFPYYDAFKGNVFGESCDFVLADKHYHPQFNAISLNSDRYYQVICSLVDTVIDLKGIANSQQIEKGIEQGIKIKAFSKKKAFRSTFRFSSKNNFIDFYNKKIIKHVLVFISGNSKNYLDYLNKNIYKNFSALDDAVIFKKAINLPDMVFFLETNTLLIKQYEPKKAKACFLYFELTMKDQPTFWFVLLIEQYKTSINGLILSLFPNFLENRRFPIHWMPINNIFFGEENINPDYIREKLGIVEKSNF